MVGEETYYICKFSLSHPFPSCSSWIERGASSRLCPQAVWTIPFCPQGLDDTTGDVDWIHLHVLFDMHSSIMQAVYDTANKGFKKGCMQHLVHIMHGSHRVKW